MTPLETLFEVKRGQPVALTEPLRRIYGDLYLPERLDRPYLMANFVSTLDGVASLAMPGWEGGSPISGRNRHDRLVMALLRSVADAVVVGSGTLRGSPTHRWTADYIVPALADEYATVRRRLGKQDQPLNVIVTGSGAIDLGLPLFQSGDVSALIVTSDAGKERLQRQGRPALTQVVAAGESGSLSARSILTAIQGVLDCRIILLEAGPHLFGAFLDEHLIDDLFLTLSPLIAGRVPSFERPGLVAGRLFAPDSPLWAGLTSVRRGADHLFLRYNLRPAAPDT